MSIKKRIESLFTGWTKLVIKLKYLLLLLVLVPTFMIASQVRNLSIDTSNEGMLHPDDPILTSYNDFRDQFGRDDLLVIAIKSEKKEIFTLSFLEKLKKLHNQLEAEIPHLNDITSLVNARDTRGEKDTLLVDDLLVHFPKNDQDLEILKNRVLANPVYRNQLISEDGSFTTILIELDTYSSVGMEDDDLMAGFDSPDTENSGVTEPQFLTSEENNELVAKAQQIAKAYTGPDFKIYIAGSPIVTQTVKRLMMKDMKKFLRLAVLTIGICLFLMFRRLSGILLPLLVVALTLITTLGLMAKFGFQFKIPTTILPSFLLAVGVGASVHVLSLVFQRLRVNDTKEEALIYALSHSGLAIMMTSLTTAAGLASFAGAKVAPVADLGLFSAIGVMLSLFYTLVLLPALIAIFPIKQKTNVQKTGSGVFDKFLDWVAIVTTTSPKTIAVLSLIVVIGFAVGIPKINFSHNFMAWLPDTMPVKISTQVIDHNLRGSVALEVILDTGTENGLYNKNVLLAMDKLGNNLESFKQDSLFVGKVLDVTTILREIHKALNENRQEMYRIPENAALIPQEFLLFENSGSDDLETFVDSRFSKARITIKVPWRDALSYVPFMREIEQRFQDSFKAITVGGQKIEVSTTGVMSLYSRILFATMHSAAQSYTIAFVVITLMMILLIGDLRIGLIAMLPNILPIIMVMGFMGWFGIPLDMFTMLVASIAIGLAVDDTIHFVYNFKKYFDETHDVHDAVKRTLHTAGRAMLATSIVLATGFFLFMFASMHNVFNFGMLVGLAIVLALLADFFLAPALMALALGGSSTDK